MPSLEGLRKLLGGLGKFSKAAEEAPRVTSYVPRPGPATQGRVYYPEDYAELQDTLARFSGAKRLPPDHSSSFEMMMSTANKPGSRVHVLSDDASSPLAAYQLQPGDELGFEGNYLANLVSLLGPKGSGRQGVVDARQFGPYDLISTMKSKPFYDKLVEEGIPRFQRHPSPELDGLVFQHKARGGLMRIKECGCGCGK